MLPTDPVINEVTNEMDRAEILHGRMCEDPVHAAAVVGEEAGELLQAALNHAYHGDDLHACREEALHTAATALRFIEALDAGRMG